MRMSGVYEMGRMATEGLWMLFILASWRCDGCCLLSSQHNQGKLAMKQHRAFFRKTLRAHTANAKMSKNVDLLLYIDYVMFIDR